MLKYQFENLNVMDLDEAGTKIQGFIDYNQCSLLAGHRQTLINDNGSIEHVSVPDGIGIVGDILLPKGVEASKLDDEFAWYLAPISIQADNYMAKIVCDAVEEDSSYENLIMLFYDPEDITEVSFVSNSLDIDKYIDGCIDECIDELEYREINGCCVIENQMFGICSVEQLLMQVMIGVKVNSDDEIVEIVYMHSSIMGD